jgi:peptidoglycan/xylan/chitin deacetylase (PgdA/CDA1 family)
MAQLDFIDKIFCALPIRAFEVISIINPILPYYHMVSDDDVLHVKHLYPYKNMKKFISDLEFLQKKYRPISVKELIEHVKRGRKLDKGSFLLSFDDGYSQMHSTVAPILYEKGIPALFFVNPGFVDNRALSHDCKTSLLAEESRKDPQKISKVLRGLNLVSNSSDQELTTRILSINYRDRKLLDRIADAVDLSFDEYLATNKPYMSSSEIREMIDLGFCFGGHSFDHPRYSELEIDVQLSQTLGSLDYLKREFSLDYSVFAFPYTDKFLKRGFFDRIMNRVDITFGTSGILEDSISFNLQRINFEKSLRPAKCILARSLLKKRVLKWKKRLTIAR